MNEINNETKLRECFQALANQIRYDIHYETDVNPQERIDAIMEQASAFGLLPERDGDTE